MEVFVARQPVFDRSRQVFGYELLYRSDDLLNEFDRTDSGSATTQVIANSLLAIGLESIVCGKKAFLDFDHGLLQSGLHSILPMETMVIEIVESADPSDELLSACRDLHQLGYTLALDHFVGHPRFEPLTPFVRLIKVDMPRTERPEQERLLRTYQPRGIAMLAQSVETHEEFEWAERAGYDYFQGSFFARPALVRSHQIPAAKINCLRLLRETQQAELDFNRLETIVSEDVSFSYKLLCYVNSALFSPREEIRSIRQSLKRLGEEAIRHWAALAALPAMAKDKPGELVTHSLVRAHFCERLATLAGMQDKNLGFLMGLFSLLDALLDVPLDEGLRHAGVGPAIRGALLGTTGEDDALRNIYLLVCHYDSGDWKAVSQFARRLGIQGSSIAEAYSESTLWAQQALHATSRKSDSRRNVRHPVQGNLHLLWEDEAGHERVSGAQLVNVSANGMQLRLTDKIPVHTTVSCNAPKLGVSGRGSVRYCNPSKGKYLVGLEFSNGTGWRGPA